MAEIHSGSFLRAAMQRVRTNGNRRPMARIVFHSKRKRGTLCGAYHAFRHGYFQQGPQISAAYTHRMHS